MENATLYAGRKARWTDAELMLLPRDGRRYELLEDLLSGGDVLPGFKCRLGRIFRS